MKCRIATVLAVLVSLMISIRVAGAQNLLEKLIMPGPLAEAHVKFEKECEKCHKPFSRAAQTQLCLDCHKEVSADRRQNSRFHGRHPDAAKRDCKYCHSEHKGRSADIIQFDRQTFNHGFADFDLKGMHKTAQCEGCHVAKTAYRKAPKQCFDCHKTDDPHKGRLGERCANCHNESSWRQVKTFDHGKTKFPLEGAHAKVSCATCHAGERYKDIERTCVACHRIQDVHAGRYGAKCETCHGTSEWKVARFDHDKTKFSLHGAHAKVKCDACHTGDLYRDKLATTCASCHGKTDPHKGKLGTRCERCHNESNWRQNVLFDHDLSRFPLIGLHAAVPCEECHRSTSYKDAPVACAKCHSDWHQGRIGSKCELCHNPNGWARWRFDHARQTRFKLTGAHEKIRCEACHTERNPRNLKLAIDCYSCHRKADAHNGTFGRACDRCHTTSDWRRLSIRNFR
jgi:hypothetical protein